MTLEQRGAYITLLAYQWDAGQIPTQPAAMSRVLGVTPAKAATLWQALKVKFQDLGDDTAINMRLEQEREKQAERRAAQAERGKSGAHGRWHKHGVSMPQAMAQASPKHDVSNAQAMLGDGLASAFASSREEPRTENVVPVVRRGGGLVRSPLEFERKRRFCAYVGARLEVPNQLHDDFVRATGGTDTDAALQGWYAAIDEEIEASGEAITPDVFVWLRARWKTWAAERHEAAEVAKFLARGK